MKLRQVAETVDSTMGLVESILVAVVGRAASWIASIPAAVMVARAVQEIFEIDPFWAAVTAVALELVGMTTSNLWLTAKEWNATKRKTDPEANTALAFALMTIYFVADFLIIAALVAINFVETGDVAGFTALLFPVLAVVGIVALNERAGHYKRVGEVERERQEGRAARQEREANRQLEAELAALEAKERERFAQENYRNRQAPSPSAHEVMLRDGWTCYYCGRDLKDVDRGQIHIDHFYPRVLGGSDSPYNLVVSCAGCNLSKNSNPPSEVDIQKFKIHLVKKSGFAAKEKVWLLRQVDEEAKQKDIAAELRVSPSYVSSLLREEPQQLSEGLTSFCEALDSVGKPESALTEVDNLMSEDEVQED